MQTTNALLWTALLCFAVPPAFARRADEPEPPTLTVGGDAEVAAAPDLAVVRLGATAQASAASAAQQQVNQVMERAIAAIRGLGVPEDAVRTASLTLHPVYSNERPTRDGEPSTPSVVAYRASNTVRVVVRDLASVGEVIDAGIGAGANQLQGLSFELRDDTEQRAEALRRALENARVKAEALARAAGVERLRIQRIEESGVRTVPVQRMAQARALETGTPVEPGKVRVSASVSLTYRIGRGRGDAGEAREEPNDGGGAGGEGTGERGTGEEGGGARGGAGGGAGP